MRRAILFCSLVVVGVAHGGGSALGQLHLHFASATADAGGCRPGWSVFKHSDRSSHFGRWHDRGGWRHRHDRGTTWLFWGASPLLWGGGYAPVFVPVAPVDPYWVQQGFNVWTPAPVARTVPQAADPPAPTPKAIEKPTVRATGAASKASAGKFLGYGDVNFKKQKYHSAVERYKTAARIAPDLAETYFRQGFALVAMGNYPSAAKAFRRGLGVRSDWTDAPFRLAELYGDNQLAKTAHRESLAKAVEANPFDAELLMLLGLHIFFDGQAERSEVFFARVAQLGGNDDKRLDSFLPHPGPAGAGKPDNKPPRDGKIVF